jgi:hypothetical protein
MSVKKINIVAVAGFAGFVGSRYPDQRRTPGPCLDSVFVWPDPGNLADFLGAAPPGRGDFWFQLRMLHAAAAPVFKLGSSDLVLEQAAVAPNRALNAQCVLLLRLLSGADEPKTD